MSELLSQGGYAWFVWGAYGMTLILLLGEVVALARQRRATLARLRRTLRLRAAEERTPEFKGAQGEGQARP